MPKVRTAVRRIRATVTQPLYTFTARRAARRQEMATALQVPCCACLAPLAAHIGAGNRWKGCKGGTR